MAISASSKILASDVSGKVDTAGTGLTKSGTTLSLATVVTAGNAGPKANASPDFGATFVVPYITYDAYGRVTGHTNRTITLPSAVSVATNVVKTVSSSSKTITVPSGGTWRVFWAAHVGSENHFCKTGSGDYAGGTVITCYTDSTGGCNGICIRIS